MLRLTASGVRFVQASDDEGNHEDNDSKKGNDHGLPKGR